MSELIRLGSISGLIIDTPASFATSINGKSTYGEKYALVKTCVDIFKSQAFNLLCARCLQPNHVVNVIIVIGHEKLNVEMRREFGDSLAVVKIPKSGGVSVNIFQIHVQSDPHR